MAGKQESPRIGHNSGIDAGAKAQLKSFVERIENIDSSISELRSDIKDVYAEAKGNGFDTKALREIIRLRKMDAEERREREAMRDIYMNALGMLATTPLGQAAIERAAANA